MNDYLQQRCDQMNAALRATNREQILSRIHYLQHLISPLTKTSWTQVGLVDAFLLVISSTIFFSSLPVVISAIFAAFLVLLSVLLIAGNFLYLRLSEMSIGYQILKLRCEYKALSDDPAEQYAARQTLEIFLADAPMGVVR